MLCMLTMQLNAQRIVSGYVQDSVSGERLIGAYVKVYGEEVSSVTNNYGYFTVNTTKDSCLLLVSNSGYENKAYLVLNGDKLPVTIGLNQLRVFKGAVIRSDRTEKINMTTQMSSMSITMAQVKMLPKFFGETDIIKAVQLMPGIKGGPEGSSGLYVRGGGPDQNLILLDGSPVYNANHLFGFFSVFNSDAINHVQVLKGGFPARYGGRLSSVLDISMKEGNMKKYIVEGSVGALASKLAIEGPIKKDKASFIVCGRRTYVDALLKPIMRAATGNYNLNQGYYFSDLNAKVNWKLNNKNRLYMSYYAGKDKFYDQSKPYTYLFDGTYITESSENRNQWGNRLGSLRWNKVFSNNVFMNTQFNYTRYYYEVAGVYNNTEESDTGFYEHYNYSGFVSSIQDLTLKTEAEKKIGKHHYRAGLSLIHHTFQPGRSVIKYRETGERSLDTSFGSPTANSIESSMYIEDDMDVNKKLKVNYGLHFNLYSYKGHFYPSIQPRIAGRYLLGHHWSLKGSYSRMNQNIHLLTSNSLGLPNDLWVPATDKVKPMNSNQYALGVAKSFPNDVELTFETYYKNMNNIIEYKEGASYLGSSSSWENKVAPGKGKSYGFEFLLQKKSGPITGWVGYTLSWATRQIPGINNGEKFFYKYDSRHDVSFVLNYKENEKWDYGLVWVYRTGNAITMPIANYPGKTVTDPFGNYYGGGNNNVFVYSGRNNFRFADYHRLDLSVTRHFKKKWGMIDWNLSIYNVYSRINPFYYKIGLDNKGNKQITRVGLFPFLPSMNIAFKF